MTQTADEPVTEASAEQAVVILSGLSGGGKTAAAKLFEDLGYMVVDNLPGELLPDLAELVSDDEERFARVAIVHQALDVPHLVRDRFRRQAPRLHRSVRLRGIGRIRVVHDVRIAAPVVALVHEQHDVGGEAIAQAGCFR